MGQVKGHLMEHEHDSLEFLQGNTGHAHRTRPGDGNLRALNIKGPTMRCSIGNITTSGRENHKGTRHCHS